VKVTPDCYDCLERLVYQASGLATEDTELRKRAEDEGKGDCSGPEPLSGNPIFR
jgi:hypothetical protein